MNETKTILVIEENVSIAGLLRIVLEESGYSVLAVTDAEEARTSVEKLPPALVLLDLGTNVNRAVEFVQWAKENQRTPFPVVMMGHDDEARRLARSLDADGWLHMPFDIDDLIDLVNRLAP